MASHQSSGTGISRKRLVPWLQQQLDDERIPGLRWIDKEQKVWQLPWKSHTQTRWGDPDALLLREYAKHMYQFLGGEPKQRELNYWKELLRNNLRSLKDVQEWPNLHDRDAESPYKVYQFTEVETVHRREGRGPGARAERQPRISDHATSSPMASPVSVPSPSGSEASQGSMLTSHFLQGVDSHFDPTTVPRFLNHVEVPGISQNHIPQAGAMNISWVASSETNVNDHIDPDLQTLIDNVNDEILNDLVNKLSLDDMNCLPFSSHISFRSRSPIRHVDSISNAHEGYADTCAPNRFMATPVNINSGACTPSAAHKVLQNSVNFKDGISGPKTPTITSSQIAVMTMEVYYFDHLVMRRPIEHKQFRICFAADEEDKETLMSCLRPEHCGPVDTPVVELPHTHSCPLLNQMESVLIDKVLEKSIRGLTIQYDDNDKNIYATRYSKAVPCFRTSDQKDFTKLERQKRVKIFDFSAASNFPSTAQNDHMNPFVTLTFSLKGASRFKKLPLMINIYHMECVHMRRQVPVEGLSSMEPVCSVSDDFDKQLEVVKSLKGDFEYINDNLVLR